MAYREWFREHILYVLKKKTQMKKSSKMLLAGVSGWQACECFPIIVVIPATLCNFEIIVQLNM